MAHKFTCNRKALKPKQVGFFKRAKFREFSPEALYLFPSHHPHALFSISNTHSSIPTQKFEYVRTVNMQRAAALVFRSDSIAQTLR